MEARVRTVAIESALVALAFAAIYGAHSQDAFWSDGRGILASAEAGIGRFPKPLFLPAIHAVDALLGPLGASARDSLAAVSLVAGAAAAGVVHATARRAGCARASALAAAAGMGLAPTAFFYATTIELHALHLLAAAIALAWIVGAARRGALTRSALPWALLAWLLAGTHPLGVLLLPGFVPLALRGDGAWRLPRRALPALLLVVAIPFALAWFDAGVGGPEGYARLAAEWGSGGWSSERLWRELGRGAWALLVPAAAGAAIAARRHPIALAAALGALVPVLAYVPRVHVAERGAYYAGLLPLLALAAARALDAVPLRGLAAWLGVALALAQARASVGDLRAWNEDYPGEEWVSLLGAEVPGEGLFVARDAEEEMAVRFHTRLWPAVATPESALVLPAHCAAAARRGGAVVVSTRAVAGDEAWRAALREELEARLGPPLGGVHPRYVVHASGASR